jgi:hypothetical protein
VIYFSDDITINELLGPKLSNILSIQRDDVFSFNESLFLDIINSNLIYEESKRFSINKIADLHFAAYRELLS